MDTQTVIVIPPLITLAIAGGISGLFLLLIGLGLGKLFKTLENAHRLGLLRPMELSFPEQLFLSIRFPTIFIPVSCIFFGGMMLALSIISAIIGVIQLFIS